LTAHEMNHENSAKFLVKLAKEKGWDSISLTGSNEFLRMAMLEAIKLELPISPKDEKQELLLREVQASMNNLPNSIQQNSNQPDSPFELPKLTPLKVGQWSSQQEQKSKEDEEELKKRKKRLGIGYRW
jgi:hypothetical protein